METLEAIKVTFFQECEELLGELEAGLLALQAGEGDEETVNAVFRAVHSVKGGAGAFGLEALVRFAHTFETTLDKVRSGTLKADERRPQSAAARNRRPLRPGAGGEDGHRRLKPAAPRK